MKKNIYKYLVSSLLLILAAAVTLSIFQYSGNKATSDISVQQSCIPVVLENAAVPKAVSTSKKSFKPNVAPEFQTGDIIFQMSSSGQAKAIQIATHSKYSHCGMIVKENGKFFVLEAVQPVKKTELQIFIDRGDHKHYVVKRLKMATKIITPEIQKEMIELGNSFSGKNYDLMFEWSDEKLYCSELVWKIYKRTTGLEVGKLQKLREFDLSNPLVKQKLKERYGNNIPYDEEVISPAAIFDSDLLKTVK